MISIKKTQIAYQSVESNRYVKHYILIAEEEIGRAHV